MMQTNGITKTTLNTKQAYTCTTEILKRVADKFGWEVTTEDREERPGEQLIYWGDVQKISHVNKQFFVKSGSYIINYFPGFVAVEKKIDHAIALRTMTLLFPKHFDFFLKTWIYPQEFKSLSSETILREPEIDGGFPRFIFKPDEESRANGIELFEDTVAISNKVGTKAGVIQTYLNNPLLWDGYKFDIRSHFVVTSLQPLQIYYCPKTLIRMCTEKFYSTSKRKKMQHITNLSFNVMNTEDETSCTRDELALQEMLHQKGYKWADIERKLVRCCIKAIIAVVPDLIVWQNAVDIKDRAGSFQVIGTDTIITNDMDIKFIEMNDPMLGTYLEREESGKMVKLHLPVYERSSVPLIQDTLKLMTHMDGFDEGCLRRVFPPQEGQTYYTKDEYTRLVDDDIFVVRKAAELFNKFNKKKSLTIDTSSFLSMLLATSIFDDNDSFDASILYKEKQKDWKTYTHYSTNLARCNYEEELSFQGFVDLLLELCGHLNGTDQLADKFRRFIDYFQ